MIIDNGKVAYAEKEPGREVTVSFLPFCIVRQKRMGSPNGMLTAGGHCRFRGLMLFWRSFKLGWEGRGGGCG
jgi:hypothetical protein